MAFQVAPADIQIHRAHRQDGQNKHPLHIGPNGPVVAFQGPEDWVHFEITPPEWEHRAASDDEKVQAQGTAARELTHGMGRIPLAVNAQGQVGYDLDWILLRALTSDSLKLTDFRTLLEREGCDPCVAFPQANGPGSGQPLPFAILNARRSYEERMRLLDCLPREALRIQHQGKTLTDVAYNQLQKNKASHFHLPMAAHVLFVWVQAATGQPFPPGAFLKDKPDLTIKTTDERKQVNAMLASKPLAAALGTRMDVKTGPGDNATRMQEKLKTYLELAPRQQALHAQPPESTTRQRRFRA